MRAIQNEMGANRQRMQDMFIAVIDDGIKRGQGYEDLKNLASITSSAGFEDVRTDVVGSDRVSETRPDLTKVVVGAIDGMVEMIRKMDGDEGYWSSDEAARMHEDMIQDSKSGKVYFRFEMMIVSAQKPR
jgi:hypothetical protein